jgi:hypothetical protein
VSRRLIVVTAHVGVIIFLTLSLQHHNMDAVTKGTEIDPLIDFVSLGMVILDEIHIPNQPPMLDVVGGSGTFCITIPLARAGINPLTYVW